MDGERIYWMDGGKVDNISILRMERLYYVFSSASQQRNSLDEGEKGCRKRKMFSSSKCSLSSTSSLLERTLLWHYTHSAGHVRDPLLTGQDAFIQFVLWITLVFLLFYCQRFLFVVKTFMNDTTHTHTHTHTHKQTNSCTLWFILTPNTILLPQIFT